MSRKIDISYLEVKAFKDTPEKIYFRILNTGKYKFPIFENKAWYPLEELEDVDINFQEQKISKLWKETFYRSLIIVEKFKREGYQAAFKMFKLLFKRHGLYTGKPLVYFKVRKNKWVNYIKKENGKYVVVFTKYKTVIHSSKALFVLEFLKDQIPNNYEITTIKRLI